MAGTQGGITKTVQNALRAAIIVGAMSLTCNSSHTNHLLQRVSDRDSQALTELLAPYRERLRKTVRLRLDPRLRGRFSSSAVLEQVQAEVERRSAEYLANPATPMFLWLRQI